MKLAVSSIIEGKVGEGTTIGYFSHILSSAQVGSHCTIGDGVTIKNAIIGDHVTIDDGVSFGSDTARSKLTTRPSRPSIVEDNVHIGSGARIVGNTVIKEGAVIADGSVVIGYVWEKTFVAGNPARRIYSLSALKNNP